LKPQATWEHLLSDTEHFAPIDHEKIAEAARRMHPGMDRRTLRTRQALHQALIRLVLERGYDQITVADIADAANVGRSTFYAHFTDKDDLLRHGIGYLKTMLTDPPGEETGPLRFSRFLTEHLRDQKKLQRALMQSSAGSIVIGALREAICDVVRQGMRVERGKAPDEIEVQFLVGAYLAVVTWWLDRGAKEAPASIDQAFRTMAEAALCAKG
jgi:AcrR family transcriptional regulator